MHPSNCTLPPPRDESNAAEYMFSDGRLFFADADPPNNVHDSSVPSLKIRTADAVVPSLASAMLSRLRESLSPTREPEFDDDMENHTENDEPKRRNRLSKPLTNSSALNLSGPANRSSLVFQSSSSSDQLSEYGSQSSTSEAYQILEAREVTYDADDKELRTVRGRKSLRRLVLNTTGREGNSPQSPNSDSDVSSPLSAILSVSRLSLLLQKPSRDTKSTNSPRSETYSRRVSDELFVSPIPPIRRKSMCQPGIATRISRDDDSIPLRPYINISSPQVGSEDDTLLQESLATYPEPSSPNAEDGVAHTPLPRTETPSDLAFLGYLKLGSLHVTNGRASPALSDWSKRTRAWSTPNLRTASLEADSHDHQDPISAPAVDSNDMDHTSPVSDLAARKSRHRSSLRFPSDEHRIPMSKPVHEGTEVLANTAKSPGQVISHGRTSSAEKAEAYLAGLPASPFAIHGRSSRASMLDPSTKPTEFEDELFDNESLSPSITDSADNSTAGTQYSANEPTARQEKSPSLYQSRYSYLMSGSDYGSTISLHASPSREDSKAQAVQEEVLPYTEPAQDEVKPVFLPSMLREDDPRLRRRPVRQSILKPPGATITALPQFENLRVSQESLVTFRSSVSTVPTSNSKRLIRRRPLAKPAQPKDIVVQGADKELPSHIPPVPVEAASNLAIRVQQVPELQHTYEYMQHTRLSPVSSVDEMMEIRFPSPISDDDHSDGEAAKRTRRQSFRGFIFNRRNKQDKRAHRRSDPQGISAEAAAGAMTQESSLSRYSLGSNPYEAAWTPRSSHDGSQKRSRPSYSRRSISYNSARSDHVNMIDAETAAKLARTRSKDLRDQETMSLAEKRALFNDRGGMPGKSLRPSSLEQTTPPMPSLSYMKKGKYRQTWPIEPTSPDIYRHFNPDSFSTQMSHASIGSPEPVYHPRTSEDLIQSLEQAYTTSQQTITPIEQPVYPVDSDGFTSDNMVHYPQDWEDYRLYHPQSQAARCQSWRSDLVEADFDPTPVSPFSATSPEIEKPLPNLPTPPILEYERFYADREVGDGHLSPPKKPRQVKERDDSWPPRGPLTYSIKRKPLASHPVNK